MTPRKRDTVRALYLDANGCGPEVIRADTILRGVFGYGDGAQPPRALARVPGVARLFATLRDFHDQLSYTRDWREAFCAAPQLDVEVCNINDLIQLSRCLLKVRSFELIVVSHVAAGDDLTVLGWVARWLARRRGPLVMFIGNEYDLLDEKIAFIRAVRADVVCSQLPVDAARYLYAECGESRVLSLPHALNPKVYCPTVTDGRRTDIGFVGDLYWPFIGDRERSDLIGFFQSRGTALGLTCEIRTQRLSRPAWAAFLNTCRGTIGAESGTYYLNDRGRLLSAARHYNLKERPDASFDDVYDRFFRGRPRRVPSGKTISSRHFEPIGTKTCQLLLDGDYNGVLRAGEHYIAIRKDLSNVAGAIEQFKDESFRQAMVDRTYDYVMAEHTYDHRVRQLLKEIGAS